MHIPERKPQQRSGDSAMSTPLSILLVVPRQNAVVLYNVATSLIRFNDR
jgi:hypothetical protein